MIKSIDGRNFVAGQLWALAAAGDCTYALVSLWSLKEANPLGWAKWQMTESPSLVPFESLLKLVIWTECSPGIARTLVPYELRGLQAVAR